MEEKENVKGWSNGKGDEVSDIIEELKDGGKENQTNKMEKYRINKKTNQDGMMEQGTNELVLEWS